MDRLRQQMQFVMEIDKLKKITRQTYISDGSRKENDSEHSWHLAMLCTLLCEYSNSPINVQKTMEMVLIHDLVEIDAGDTYAYDEAGNSTKRERELKAADRIFHLLPDEQAVYFRNLWDEFEEAQTAEAKFALAVDKIQPLLLNDFTGGKAWREHEVKESQVMKRCASIQEGSEQLWEFVQEILQKNIACGNIRSGE